jgi:transcriptional regulator of acetoin/glycerol metabolism
VLKPFDMGEDALTWQSAVLGGLEPAGVRVAAPLRTAEGALTAVIDLSPCRRPTAYAAAIVLVDAVLWHRAPLALLDLAGRHQDGPQCLLRAVAFRLLCEDETETATAAVAAYGPLAERARALAGRA